MRYTQLDTPTLLIDREILIENLNYKQSYADINSVALRPHTKTHKMPFVANMQIETGASGITVAKVGEAEVMAANGIKDIFIANENNQGVSPCSFQGHHKGVPRCPYRKGLR
ncbi:hypothetical protein ACPUYX_18040 [Desulfosporosinus sp. SYSU MS00001]|uniref:hypothetical protein n=1 Tax=Desulfosporosinus sp. SYSU MS00001 TaxID=3416284 RepID=UPI003CE741A9